MTTIDYKALAGRIKTHADDLDAIRAALADRADITDDPAADLRTLVSLLEWMAGQEPIYAYEWDTYDGAVRRSFSPAPYNGREPTRTLMLFLHPAPQPQQRDGMSKIDEKANALHSEAMAKLDELGLHPAPQPQPEPTDSYDAIWNALHEIDSAAVFLPTFEVKHEGGIEAVTKNIVEAIRSAAVLLQPQPERQPVSEPTEAQTGHRPSREWYARKIQETLDHDFVIGPAFDGEPTEAQIEPMSLAVALDFADNPRPYHTLQAPADTNGELYRALRVLAAAYRAALAAKDER